MVQESSRNSPDWRLSFGFFGGPILWALQIMVGYGLTPLSCSLGISWPVYLAVFLSALIVLTAGFLAYQSWQAWSDPEGPDLLDVDERTGRREFIGAAGFFHSALFFVLILATGVSALFLNPCPVITLPFP